jgi:hypothetical protein
MWFHKSKTQWRDLVTDLSHFKSVLPDFDTLTPSKKGNGNKNAATSSKSIKGRGGAGGRGAIPSSTSSKKQKSKSKGKGDEEVESKVGNTKLATKVTAALDPFFDTIGWSRERFTEECSLIYTAMLAGTRPSRSERLSDRLGPRILSLCGLPWNRQSAHKNRDYANLSLVVTIETALVQAYRKSLVDECLGARALRSALKTFFLDHAAVHSTAQGNEIKSVIEWEFADMPVVGCGKPDSELAHELARRRYDAEELSVEWEASNPSSDSKKDPVAMAVLSWQKNKYLRCSNPDAPPGAVESRAYYLLLELAKVFLVVCSLFSPTNCIPRRSCI